MPKTWFRVHAEGPSSIIDNVKIYELSDKQFRWLLMLWACSCRTEGWLPPLKTIAFRLHKTEKAVTETVEDLVTKRFIDRFEEGYFIHDWLEHQFQSDSSTERVRKFRERSGNVSCNVTETPRARVRSESESVSGSVSVVVSENQEIDVLKREQLLDEQWLAFQKAWVGGASDDDWRRAYFAWKVLDFQQKRWAIEGLARDHIGKDNCLPQNYIEKRIWQRAIRSNGNGINTRTAKEAATINAAKRFLENR